MIVIDITDGEKAELAAVLKRVAEGMNVPQAQKDVAIKVARQIIGAKVVA